MFHLPKNTWLFVIAMLTLLSAQNAFAWGTSPSSGSTYTFNGWGSDLKILFEGPLLEAIPAAERLQVELLTAHVDGSDSCSTDTSAATPCLWLHGKVPACIDENTDGSCYLETVVKADMNVSVDPLTLQASGAYTASGKKTHIEGYITCEGVLAPGPLPSGANCADVAGFPAEIGLPKGGNYNNIFPANGTLEASELLRLVGYPGQPVPTLRHCFEQGILPADVDGVVDCGKPNSLRTADGEVTPYIDGLLFESTTQNLNLGKAADSFAINVNILSQTNPDGLVFHPADDPADPDNNPIDFTKSLAIEGTCDPIQFTESDYNGDGILDVRVKYDAGCVSGLQKVIDTPDGSTVDLNITGTLLDGIQFKGSFTVLINQ
jgi:hypothetical protein